MSLAQFFLNGAAEEVAVESLSLSHTSWSKEYHLVRNMPSGGTLTLEDSTSQVFEHYPFELKGDLVTGELDQPIKILLGDLGEIIPVEIDAMIAAGTTDVLPKAVLRLYSSANLAAPLEVVVRYVTGVSRNAQGATLEANAPSMNKNRTGELYTLDRFPTLKAFI